MRRVVFGLDGRLRNGWWALAFLAVLAVLLGVHVGVVRLLTWAGIPKGPWLFGLAALMVLAATWVCTRLRREPLSSVGLKLDARWARELGWGTALGAGQIALAAFMLWSLGGVRFQLDPAHGLRALATGFLVFVAVAFLEELLYRGFLFQRLRDGMGTWPAQVLLAALFALAHWGNPGMDGMVRIWATLDIAIGALVLGLAWLRTRSLALPVGIHLGWNWMQGPVLGFAVSGTGRHEGWFRPTFMGDPSWFSGGEFGLEASVFAVIVDVLLLGALLAWKGSTAPASQGEDPEAVTSGEVQLAS
jgi:membrane protease YdiL (CAAX protease family)